MIIGIDLDNTIAMYNNAIKKLPNGSMFESKEDYSKNLINNGKNELWTELQGSLYGPLMQHAQIAENFDYAIKYFSEKKYQIKIVSHRTIYPYKGEKYNLHNYAQEWINNKLIQIFKENQIKYDIYLCQTKEEKIQKIIEQKCNFFVDDLISIYEDKNFPKEDTKFILYNSTENNYKYNMSNWLRIKEFI